LEIWRELSQVFNSSCINGKNSILRRDVVAATARTDTYELLNETIFKSLDDTLCTLFWWWIKERANIPFLIWPWVQKTVLPPSGKIWTKVKMAGNSMAHSNMELDDTFQTSHFLRWCNCYYIRKADFCKRCQKHNEYITV
jgi:hypothetical protein